MSITLPLPSSTATLIGLVPAAERHPGLQLDKHVTPCPKQEQQKDSLLEVCQAKGDAALLQTLLVRRTELFEALKNRLGSNGVRVWRCTTAGPLTLHLARASALENAGICLHPVYGFVYLPGSGLKGMARAYAERVWLPAQENAQQAWRKIEDVFGWAPNTDRQKQIRDRDHPAHIRRVRDDDSQSDEVTASVGGILFHDAWPEEWPRLTLDLVNNHHTAYYDGSDPPGDWEEPNMVSFLVVGRDCPFRFVLTKRRSDVADELLSLAFEWLNGALVHDGAGAKTAAGYGRFRAESTPTFATIAGRKTLEVTLELLTPAFPAGAAQQREDCELRSATFRGLLRWWWRTLHAGFMDFRTLRRLEAAVWGDTHIGGAARVVVQPLGGGEPYPFDRPFIISKNALPAPPDKKTTQGLVYHSYGMDEKKEGKQVRRFFLAPGAKWTLHLTSVGSTFYRTDARNPDDRVLLDAQLIQDQARAALWLLCHLGGVGAKSRKGFGCLSDFSGMNLDECRRLAAEFRKACGLTAKFDPARAESFSVEQLLVLPDASQPWLEVPTHWTNCWYALDQVASVAQQFAQKHKHNLEKKALGLPRRVGMPVKGSFRPGRHVKDRHASPVIYHLTRTPKGTYTVRIAAFVAGELPNPSASRKMLEELLQHLQSSLPARVTATAKQGTAKVVLPAPAKAGTAPTESAPVTVKPGLIVDAEIVDDPKGKGRLYARHAGTALVGNILNPEAVPAESRAVGVKVRLEVASVNMAARQIAFRWPKA